MITHVDPTRGSEYVVRITHDFTIHLAQEEHVLKASKADHLRRQYTYHEIDLRDFGYQVVFATGAGLFSDAYSLFSMTIVAPILGIVYYGGTMPRHYEIALVIMTFPGALLGHIVFGILADRYGRRRFYGLETVISIMGVVGTVSATNGVNGSVSMMGWLLSWRFILGIGMGGSLSTGAVICAEFAPSRFRGKMLVAQLVLQPLGQLVAMLVSLALIARHRNGELSEVLPTNCTGECLQALDSTWRWILGVACIPYAVVAWFRLTIPESPRYFFDQGLPKEAMHDLSEYIGKSQSAGPSSGVELDLQQPRTASRSSQSSIISSTNSATSTVSRISIETSYTTNNSDSQIPESLSKGFYRYFWSEGNLRTIVAMALCSAFVDLPYNALLLNTPRIMTLIWNTKEPSSASIYSQLVQLCWQSIVAIPIGGLTGYYCAFSLIDKLGRRNVQMLGFLALLITFIVIGASFNALSKIGTSGTPAMAIIYMLCQACFTFGPSTTTHISPAEVFPTRYRGFSHGVTSASGKLGSIIGLLFLSYIEYSQGIDYKVVHLWLPYSMLVFAFFPLCGLVISANWIPGVEYSSEGLPKTLEDWAVGRANAERR
ncbi:MFS general substrate transporter [Hyaloscypha variabilis F]|uniref:MFS general substrate transporter n=1 Tax=Hyaloscypha variabilis (strain UAMH 11265 / GT02V1 / F) TaxID=1149755 RepID=A0A2J6RM58_HYAVF|nr:MFS general substrate transporter [Hyaloscypha variabilis F]